MKFLLLYGIIAAGFIINTGSAESLSEDDGFRRLLRRASAEADKPLVREQRRNKDEDDEDVFNDVQTSTKTEENIESPSKTSDGIENVRKRREDEDQFYHTLLSRAEPKSRKDKRSSEVDDVDNKAGYIVREDWTGGDSKISDVDRKELESLFQKLNADEGPEKIDNVRSTPDDDKPIDAPRSVEPKTPVNIAASDYASWLMGQPATQLSASLTHKAVIDHTLTKLFFEDKRGIGYHNNNHHNAHKRHKEDDNKPGNVRYPDPPHWAPRKKSFQPRGNLTRSVVMNATKLNVTQQSHNATLSGNSTTANCSTAECLCTKTCFPKTIITTTPCSCKEEATNSTTPGASDAKNVILQGSKLCTDDSPRCLCTRACFPKTVSTIAPCNCEEENTAATKNITFAKDIVKPAVPAPKIFQANLKYTEKSGEMQINMKTPQACKDNTPECKCKKMCHPNPISEITPCKCDVLINNATLANTNKTLSSTDIKSNAKNMTEESAFDKLNLALETPLSKIKQAIKTKTSSQPGQLKMDFNQLPPLHHDLIDILEAGKQAALKATESETEVKPVLTPEQNSLLTNPSLNSTVDNTAVTPSNDIQASEMYSLPSVTNTNAETNFQLNNDANAGYVSPVASPVTAPAENIAPVTAENEAVQNVAPAAPFADPFVNTDTTVLNAINPEPFANTQATITDNVQALASNYALNNMGETNTKTNIGTPADQPRVNSTNTTKADQRTVVDPLARTWCKQACHPLGVQVDNPCKCVAATPPAPATAQAAAQAPVVRPVVALQPLVKPVTAATVTNQVPVVNPVNAAVLQTRGASALPQVIAKPVVKLAAPVKVNPAAQILQKPMAAVLPGAPAAPLFPPKAPGVFPPKAPEAARTPVAASYQPIVTNPAAVKVAAVPNAAVVAGNTKPLGNVAGPSAAIVQATGLYAKLAVPQVAAAAVQSQVTQPAAVLPNAAAAAVVTQTAANPIANPSVVNANVRHDVHKDEPLDNQCTRTCSPSTVLRNKPCTCAKLHTKNTTVARGNPAPVPVQKQQVAAVEQLAGQVPVNVQQQAPIQQVVEPQGLFGTNAPIYTTHSSYQGCFKDRMPVRDLPKRFTRYDATPESCISECKYQNYKFAGVQYGYLCFCGNAFGRYGRVNDNDCNSRCNGDVKRNCGAFWHNSVYSVDGKESDPTDFDFAKVDAAERARDTLPAPAVRQVPSYPAPVNQHRQFIDTQGANLATHLMKAAQAALQAAKKLLPSVSKKHKVHRKGHKRSKYKREDDEEDAEIMQNKMAAMASLSAAKQIMQKTNFGLDKRDAEREKRSIDEDRDPYDPDDGKDLLTAYMSNVDIYKRQVRSVDDDEEDDEQNDKTNFEYRRMIVGDKDDGEFVEKYEDEEAAKTKTKRSVDVKRKRSVDEKSKVSLEKAESSTNNTALNTPAYNSSSNATVSSNSLSSNSSVPMESTNNNSTTESTKLNSNTTQPLIQETTNATKASQNKTETSKAQKKDEITEANVPIKEKRSLSDNPVVPKSSKSLNYRIQKRSFVTGERKRRSTAGESATGSRKRRSNAGESATGRRKRRSNAEESATGSRKRRSVAEESATGSRKRRSVAGESATGSRKRRSTAGESATGRRKRRSTAGESATDSRKKRSVAGESATGSSRKKRSVTGESETGSRKRRSTAGESATGRRKRRSVVAESATGSRKRRSVAGESATGSRKRSVTEGSATSLKTKRSAIEGTSQINKPSITEGNKKRREVEITDLPEGAIKMAARGSDSNDLETMTKRDVVAEEDKDAVVDNEDVEEEDEDAEMAGEAESGSGDYDDSDEDSEQGSGSESGESDDDKDDDHEVERRDVESDMEDLFEKRSADDTPTPAANSSMMGGEQEKAHLRSDVEKGVDSLLNLVVELYKQQKTIKAFESSVRSLRHDILRELNVPRDQKSSATSKVRDEIQKTARERLHVLTSSIEHKITEFAKTHPEASKQANLASSLLPKLPLGDAKFLDSKKEISRRSAEFDNIEDAFTESNAIPDILREHFKRNAEPDIEFEDSRPKRQLVHGEQKLSRMHRDVLESETEVSQEDAVEELENLFD